MNSQSQASPSTWLGEDTTKALRWEVSFEYTWEVI